MLMRCSAELVLQIFCVYSASKAFKGRRTRLQWYGTLRDPISNSHCSSECEWGHLRTGLKAIIIEKRQKQLECLKTSEESNTEEDYV
eukprot:1887325-Amphidinium_carterae.2